jgi:hypoxanthine phosphoribosyltransferase
MASPAEVRDRTGGQDVRRIVYSEEEIAARVAEMAAEIAAAYPPEEELLVLGTLKGSFIFLADLVRQIRRPMQVDFIGAASYGSGTVSSGRVDLVYDAEAVLAGRNVLLVEDIIDSGHTIASVLEMLQTRQPASLKVCTLLDKAERREVVVPIDYRGFSIPSKFVFGYGLDLDEYYRNLPFIGVAHPDRILSPEPPEKG